MKVGGVKAPHKTMNVFDEPGMKDGMSSLDVEALTELVSGLKEEPLVIEVGSWKGHSTSVIGEIVKRKGGKLVCVDHWRGSEGVFHHRLETDCFSTFRKNMESLGLMGIINPMVMDSETASGLLRDGIADLIFIDADHRYSAITKDIKNWLPKVKQGGIFCGHDCELYYSQCTEKEKEIIERNLENDCPQDISCHPGVVKAVSIFDNYEIKGKVWFIKAG